MQIVGRRSSVFTRLPLLLAEELAVPCDFVPIHDMTVMQADVYAGNPALKLPVLRDEGAVLFGALNICRAIAEKSDRTDAVAGIVWPEQLRDTLSRNAHELVWHGMTAQVQIVMGTVVGRLPADNMFFAKARTGLEASLAWLDANLDSALQALPRQRTLSIFEIALFCLVEHLAFRQTVMLTPYARLTAFAAEFARRGAAERTAYRMDPPPPR